jgi:putative MFS transporter
MSTTDATQYASTSRNLHSQLASAIDRIGLGRAQKLVLLLVAIGTIFDAIEQFNVAYAAPSLTKVWHLSGTQVGLLSTATFGGVAAGCLLAGILGDRIGRKTTYLYNLGLYTFGALIGAFAPNSCVLYDGRIVVGIGLGGELNTGVTLVSELVPTRVRGACTAVVNIAGGGLGIFFSTALAWLIINPLGDALGGPTESWRWLLGVLVLPALLVFVYRRYVPESPRFLLSQGRVNETNKVLTLLEAGRLRWDGRPIKEFVKAPEGSVIPREVVRLTEVFRGVLRRRTVVLWVISFMAFGAQDTITIFMPSILVKQGYGIASSLTFTLIINLGGLIGAILASFAGHYWRRRIVLGYGAMAAIVIAIAFVQSPNLALVLFCGTVFQLISMMLNTLIWVYAPELYPTRVRAFGVGASVFIASMAGSIIPPVAGRILDAWGAAGIFGLVTVMYLVMAVVVPLGPETLGKSLEQLSELDESEEESARPAFAAASDRTLVSN